MILNEELDSLRVERPYGDLDRELGNLQLYEVLQEQVQGSPLGMRNPACISKSGYRRLESSPTERDLGVWTDGKLNMS